MLHYLAAVLHRQDQRIEELLAPYDENLQVEKYVEYTREEAIKKAREWYSNADKLTDDECWQRMAEDAGEGMSDEEGNLYSQSNPRGYWDWWSEGGRWSGLLKLKNGGSANSARLGDIDFSPDEAVYQRSLRFWDVVVDHKPKEEGEEFFSFYKEQYYREYYGDRESYARRQAAFSTYAVITPDGEWHAPGRMGWWAMSSETGEESRDWYSNYQKRFLNDSDPNLILTIVDCHI